MERLNSLCLAGDSFLFGLNQQLQNYRFVDKKSAARTLFTMFGVRKEFVISGAESLVQDFWQIHLKKCLNMN